MTISFSPAWLRRKDASRYLKEKFSLSYTPNTLAKMASAGGGPKFQYAGRFPMYPVSELDEFAQKLFSPLVNSTSQRKVADIEMARKEVSYE